MSLLDRLLEKRARLLSDLQRIDKRIVRNGGPSMFKELNPVQQEVVTPVEDGSSIVGTDFIPVSEKDFLLTEDDDKQ